MVATEIFESLISHPATGHDTEPVPTTENPDNFKIHLNIIYYLPPFRLSHQNFEGIFFSSSPSYVYNASYSH
jgi:hypothetical protein